MQSCINKKAVKLIVYQAVIILFLTVSIGTWAVCSFKKWGLAFNSPYY